MIWTIYAVALACGLLFLAKVLIQGRRRSLVNRLSSNFHEPSFLKTELGFARSLFRVKKSSSQRNLQLLAELPEVLEMVSVALSAGDSLFAALARVVPKSRGVLANELEQVLLALEIGGDLSSELGALARRVPHPHVVEFANKLALAHSRGSPLAEMMREQAKSARSELRNQLLKQAGKKETLMLLPLVFLILPVTVLFAVYPSLEILKISYL